MIRGIPLCEMEKRDSIGLDGEEKFFQVRWRQLEFHYVRWRRVIPSGVIEKRNFVR